MHSRKLSVKERIISNGHVTCSGLSRIGLCGIRGKMSISNSEESGVLNTQKRLS